MVKHTLLETQRKQRKQKNNQQMVKAQTKHTILTMIKERQQTYNVIFI
jgi:hypothetical protein